MDIRAELADICSRHDVILCYAFGSHRRDAAGYVAGEAIACADPLADLDLGVVFASLQEGPARRRIYSLLYYELQELFNMLPLDLTFLQETNSVFQVRALVGDCLFASSPEDRFAYEEAVLRRAADFSWVLAAYQRERASDLLLEVGS